MPGDKNIVGGGTSWFCRDQRKSNFTHEYPERVHKFHADTRSVTSNKLYEMLCPHAEQVALAVTFVFEQYSFRIETVLTQVIHGLPRSLQANVGDITSGHDRYIQNISKFIIHQSSYHPTLCTLLVSRSAYQTGSGSKRRNGPFGRTPLRTGAHNGPGSGLRAWDDHKLSLSCLY
jgi:hypothetical protein